MALDLRALYTSLNDLREMPRFVFLEAKDDFFREDLCKKYIDKWKEAFPKGEKKTCSAAELLAKRDMLESSFFSAEKLIVLSEVSFKGKKIEEFISVLKTSPQDVFFFFSTGEPLPKALQELAKEKGCSLALEPIKPWERGAILEGWIFSYVRKQRKKMAAEAANALAQAFSQDRFCLAQELDKLIVYAQESEEIKMKDVEALCNLENKTSSWNLLDALFAQDIKGIVHALTYLEEWNEIALLRFLRGQIEKFMLAESTAAFRTKTQLKQFERAQSLGVSCLLSWITALEMHEVSIKSGEKEASMQDLLPLLLSFVQKR